jgi:hypothetical protein
MNLSAPPPILVDDRGQLANSALRTPRAAAIAGIVFSLLLICNLWLLRVLIPADPLEAGEWLATGSGTVSMALNLVPFAGVAFMWFLGVLRDRPGAMEDKFFATAAVGYVPRHDLHICRISAAEEGSLILAYSASATRPARWCHIRLCSHIYLRGHARLCLQDGRCLHGHNFHARPPN